MTSLRTDWWKVELRRLLPNDMPSDRLIVELENVLALHALEADTVSEPAGTLRKLLLLGFWPFEELRNLILAQKKPALHRLDKLYRRRASEIEDLPLSAFIALPFREVNDDLYEKIVCPACYWEDFRPIRVDREAAGMRTAVEKTREAMAAADVFVADITGSNANVFYELGYLDALGKAGVLISQDPGERLFYAEQREVGQLEFGAEGVAQSRAKLRSELRGIKRTLSKRGSRRVPTVHR